MGCGQSKAGREAGGDDTLTESPELEQRAAVTVDLVLAHTVPSPAESAGFEFRPHGIEGVGVKDQRMRPRLRLFVGADEPETAVVPEPEVSMRLEDLTRVLADAIIWDRTWVQDFADDEIRVSADLFEILSAYSHLRPSA